MRRTLAPILLALSLVISFNCGGGQNPGGAGGEGDGAGRDGAGGTSNVLACFDLFTNPAQGGTPIACCPVVKRQDCDTIPDGNYAPDKQGRCVEGPAGTHDFCSCSCTRGEWTCGC